MLPPPPPRPNASKKEKDAAVKAYKAWKERVGFNPKNKIPPPPQKKETIKVIIKKKGGLLVNEKPTRINNLKNILDNIEIDKEEVVVIIETDRGSKYSDVYKSKRNSKRK